MSKSDKCDSSPNGEHEGQTDTIIIKGRPVIRLVCRWCGKNMGKLCLEERQQK